MGLFDYIEDEGLRQKAEEAHQSAVKELQDSLDTKIEEAVSGLKAKNEELLDEKKKIQTTLKDYKDLDPEKAREALRFLEENEDAQLIKDGKIEELLEKRTSTLRSDHEATLKELQDQLKEIEAAKNNYKTQFHKKVIDDTLRDAAIAAKVRPEAIPDILLRGASVFSLAKDNSVEARDSDGKLRKTEDDKVLNPKNWLEGLKLSSPHYWPGSEGAGAHGGGSGDADDLTAAMAAAAKKGDMATYRKLRAKQKA